ncbi:MAG: hypothetical protein EBQ56_09145 [Proteobacteria bacterium]|nr:hypothetical protein [Pseudomonadota bacterium]NDE06443.1 hypothetical protein [Chloroflexota bacterium]NBT02163.1 hypothetical protein [Pseudomonadota bacterium]NBY47921.1 hypothetical protein [Pseudomonadota bacterium]NDB19966.1 hypothetical protein [Pseudomonadota bacterium]
MARDNHPPPRIGGVGGCSTCGQVPVLDQKIVLRIAGRPASFVPFPVSTTCVGVSHSTLRHRAAIGLGENVASTVSDRDTRCTGNLVHANIWSVNSHGFGSGFQMERPLPYRDGPD